MKRLTFPRAGLLALLGALPAWCAAASIGIVTIAEGEASVVREAQRFAVAEGLRVRDEDLSSVDDMPRSTTDRRPADVPCARRNATLAANHVLRLHDVVVREELFDRS